MCKNILNIVDFKFLHQYNKNILNKRLENEGGNDEFQENGKRWPCGTHGSITSGL